MLLVLDTENDSVEEVLLVIELELLNEDDSEPLETSGCFEVLQPDKEIKGISVNKSKVFFMIATSQK